MPDYEPANHWQPAETYDVLIVGGGITGVTTAMLLQQAGKKCILAEAHNLGFGTTGGTTAHLNTFLDTPYHTIASDFGQDNAALVAEAVKETMSFIKQQVTQHGIEGYSEKPAILFSTSEQEEKELDKLMTSANEVHVRMSYTQHIPLPIPFTKAVMTETQAQFHPIQYITALAKAYEQAGGVILQHCRVLNTDSKTDVVYEAATNLGNIKALRIIYATHIPPGINLLDFRCAPYRSYAMAVTLKNEAYPQELAYDMQDPYHYYRTQEVAGKKYLIIGGEDHKTGHEENTDNCFRRLESYARQYLDIDEVVFKWSSQYYEPADGLAYIGRLPGADEHIFVATGFGGNGMIYGTLSAIILCDLIVKGESRYAKLFDPNRVKPVAGFSNFVKENADVAMQMIKGFFSAEKMPDMLELAPGDASVVVYDGHKLAVYKDEQHRLHMVSPTCPHAKCAVAWNKAERSWDCPCHGSRFSVDGELWTGPSRKDLETFQPGNQNADHV